MTGKNNSTDRRLALKFNEQMLEEAKKLAFQADAGTLSLPAKLPTFEKIWIGSQDDKSINFMTAIKSEKGTVYILGTHQ